LPNGFSMITFDCDTGVPRCLRREPLVAEEVQDRGEHRRRRRDVEQPLHVAPELALDRVDVGRQPVEGRGVVVSAGNVRRVRRHPVPHVGLQFAAGKFLDRLGRQPAKLVVGNRLPPVAHEEEIRRQQVVVAEIVNRRDQLARREVTRGAEDHDHGGRRAPVLAEPVQETDDAGCPT
jgi:hypothetical protein